jgi:DNA-binding MarR family transcriptional regulator
MVEIIKKNIIHEIFCISARIALISNRYIFEPLNLTMSTVKILGLLDGDKELHPTEILNFFGSSKSNITQRLNLLEREGLIGRIYKDEKDKRKAKIRLTVKGRKKIEEIKTQAGKKAINFDKNFSAEERKRIYNFFNKLKLILDNTEKEFLNNKKFL